MQLVINNLTGSIRTYLSGAISVSAGGSSTVTSTVQQLALSTDGVLRSDISTGLATVGDGTTNYGAIDALNYLLSVTQNIGPLSDSLGNSSVIKAANVSPTTSDQALVVTLSPNSSPLSAVSGSGTINALNGTIVAPASSGAITWSLSGTWVGTVTTQAQNGDGQWWNVATLSNQSGLITGSTSINGILEMNSAGWLQARLIATAWTSGTLSASYAVTASTHIVIPYSLNPANMLVTAYLSDGSGNAITSTTINSKQRLDINQASEAVDGATAPFFTSMVGGKDVNGNIQTLSTDTTGALFTTERLPLTGSSPAAVSVGVASGVVIATNASRRGLVLTNTSNAIISFNIVGGAAVLREGITLYPGGHWEMDAYTFTTAAINGIASAAASNLAIQELT